MKDEKEEKERLATVRRRVLYGVGTAIGSMCVVTLPFMIIPWLPRKHFGALPYMHTSKRRIDMMLSHSRIQQVKLEKQKRHYKAAFADLGSGDGIAVLAAAHRGFISHGYELNPWLVLYARTKAVLQGVGPTWLRPSLTYRKLASKLTNRPLTQREKDFGRAKFYLRNLWKVDISPYDVIMVFGVQSFMHR